MSSCSSLTEPVAPVRNRTITFWILAMLFEPSLRDLLGDSECRVAWADDDQTPSSQWPLSNRPGRTFSINPPKRRAPNSTSCTDSRMGEDVGY